MKYYILEFDDEFEITKEMQVPSQYEGISLNLGIQYDTLPTVVVIVKSADLPDCIPNHRRYIILNHRTIEILLKNGVSNFQQFPVILKYQESDIGTTYKLMNFLDVVNCIDREKSELTIDEDEEDGEVYPKIQIAELN